MYILYHIDLYINVIIIFFQLLLLLILLIILFLLLMFLSNFTTPCWKLKLVYEYMYVQSKNVHNVCLCLNS